VDTTDAPRRYDASAPLVLDPDPVAQWLDWEEQANLIGFRTSTRPIEIDVVLVPRAALEVHILPEAPEAIVSRFLRGPHVCFPRHPLNRDPNVAFFDSPVAERWTARFTSSRTLALPGPESGAALSSLKLATDRPHPDFHQPEKVRLSGEAIGAVDWVRVLKRVDPLLEPLTEVALVTEVLVVLAAGGESGFMVRDLQLFQDGNYYMPGLSLPWVGRQIARANDSDFVEFWGRHYAEQVGRVKARLFARYGLWYETPNPQNILVQLSPALRPTGRLVFRDVGDGEGGTDVEEARDVPWTRVLRDLRPETENSFWAFSDAGDLAIDSDTLQGWCALHDCAYFAELARWFPELAPGPETPPEARLDHWNRALQGESAGEAIARAFARQRRSGEAVTRGSGEAEHRDPAPDA